VQGSGSVLAAFRPSVLPDRVIPWTGVTALHIVMIVYTTVLWLPGLFSLWRLPRCRSAEAEDSRPTGPAARRGPARSRVSVIVPALNEERRLGPLLASLGRQSRPADEVLVVDDGSTDGTAALARRLGARVVAAPARPAGWVGKNWACWTGSRAAAGGVLVFLDADVRLADDGMERLIAERERRGGLVSVQPYHAVGSAVERLSAICNIVVMGSLGAFTPFGDRVRSTGGFGPCLVVSRADYRACGGHAAVRDRVVEDMAFGEAVRRRGLPVACLAGRGCVDFRMYPDGLPAMVEGWSRGLATGSGQTPLLARSLAIAWIIGATTSVLLLGMGIRALAAAARGGVADAAFGATAAGLYVAYAAQAWWMMRRIGSFGPATALAFPLPLLFFHGVFARSLWLAKLTGSATWRGRRVSLGRRRRKGRTAGG
jgi:4,4'-diaponeurosporenoate glycosyltransferase